MFGNSTVARIVGGYEVIGGLSALVASAFLASRFWNSGGLLLLVCFVLFTASVVSIAAGVLLWLGRPAGRPLSIVLQAIFLPRLASPILSYQFFVGLDFTLGLRHWLVDRPGLPVGVRGTEVMVSMFFPVNLSFSILRPSASYGLGVDVTALVILSLLLLPRFRRATPMIEPRMTMDARD